MVPCWPILHIACVSLNKGAANDLMLCKCNIMQLLAGSAALRLPRPWRQEVVAQHDRLAVPATRDREQPSLGTSCAETPTLSCSVFVFEGVFVQFWPLRKHNLSGSHLDSVRGEDLAKARFGWVASQHACRTSPQTEADTCQAGEKAVHCYELDSACMV